jgi:hypothetical protein
MKDFYKEDSHYIQMKKRIMKLDIGNDTKLDLLQKTADVVCSAILHGLHSGRGCFDEVTNAKR